MNPAGTTQAVEGLTGLDRLVSQVIDTLFEWLRRPAGGFPIAAVHQARRLRQAGDLDGALGSLAELDMAHVTGDQARWVYAEWLDLVRRRFPDRELLVYSPGTGRGAALTPGGNRDLEVLAVLGLRWQPGKLVSRRSLRGLKSLKGGRQWLQPNSL